MKIIGYLVTEVNDDGSIEQVLGLSSRDRATGRELPDIVDWPSDGVRRYLFPTRATARAAIARTKHYREAFGEQARWPDPRWCRVVAVEGAEHE